MPTKTIETQELTCAYCREQFRIPSLSAQRQPLVVRCPHCTNVYALSTDLVVTSKAKAAA